VGDLVKGLLLTTLIGGPVFAGLVWFFSRAGDLAWLYSWAGITAVQFLLIYIAPVFIMPLFNKFVPLDDGELKASISSYAEKEGFSLRGIFTMDGSKRSTKSNAYFTGFGRWRRIVLFDTLIEKHSVAELVSVLAHEVGHYKLKHIQKMLAVAVLSTGLMFFILSLFITRPGLYAAFGLEMAAIDGRTPVYAGLILFGFLYAPISLLLGLVQNRLSRKHEYEADAFAATTYGRPDAMIEALKKLSVDNLSNLTPHPLKVFLEYSHPPVLERIRAIRNAESVGQV
jgi:STE24 endopeptidase